MKTENLEDTISCTKGTKYLIRSTFWNNKKHSGTTTSIQEQEDCQHFGKRLPAFWRKINTLKGFILNVLKKPF